MNDPFKGFIHDFCLSALKFHTNENVSKSSFPKFDSVQIIFN